MKNRMLVALSAAAAAAFLSLSARAEIAEEPLLNPNDPTDVWGKKITGLGDNGDETALVFTKTGATMSWTLPDGVKSIRYLVVGGGGGGGACFGNSYSGGGGGGAGGLLTDTMVVAPNAQLAITVGKGGGGAPHTVGNSNNSNIAGTNGVASVLVVGETTLTAKGGGGGGSGHYKKQAPSGGCGGGGSAGYAGGSGSQGGNGGTSASGVSNNYPGGGGGGAGGAGGACRHDGTNSGGYGGVGVESDITGEPLFYAGGGGGGSRTSAAASGGQGGGGKGGSSGTKKGGDATFYGGGGGGTYNNPGSSVTGGAGYQGIVVVRYSTAKQKNPVVLPEVKGVAYNGELQKADETGFELDKYDVVNEGGTDAGSYPVTFSLKNPAEDEWVDDHSSTNKTLYFVIGKAANGWVTQPSLSKTSWELDADPAMVNAGVATVGESVVTYDEGEDVMPLTIGTHKAVFTVEESQNYLGLSKTINYTINKNTNSWTVEPSLSKTTWTVENDPGMIVAGEARYGEIVVTYDDNPVLTELPTSVGRHTVVFSVAEDETYTGLLKPVEYTVTKVPNAWLIEPGLTKTIWAFDEEPGEIVDGEAKYGDVVVTYDDDPSLVDLPTDLGSHTVKFAVAETDTCTGLEKVVDYSVTKKQHKWTVPPKVPATVNIEDGVSFPMPAAEPDVEVTAYFDGDPGKTELTEIAVGETHTVTYAIAGDDDWDEVKQTLTFKGVYKAIVDQADPSKVYGYRIPKLGANQNEVALVFTNTGYTADNPMTLNLPQEVTAIGYLVVGGGGAGATSNSGHGSGGGGAGGVVTNDEMLAVTAGEVLSVYVGAGGRAYTTGAAKNGGDGVNSGLVIDGRSIVAKKGAGGVQQGAGKGGDAYACGSGAGNSANGTSGRAFAGGEGEVSNGAGVTTIGSNGGGGGGAGASATSAVGGEGIAVTIFSDEEYYIAGGGSGTSSKWESTDGSVGGGGYANRWGTYGTHIDAGAGTRWGAGGGGGGNNAAGGAGHQGVVVVRYVNPQGVVMVPYITPKTYTGEVLVADVPANVGYIVTENAGGTDVGEYTVILTLNKGYHWDGGSTEPANLVFAITPAQNEWTVEPSITKATWLTTDDPGVLTPGETKFGSPTATITKDGGDAESFDGTLPTAAGRYVVVYTVETSDNWIDPEVTEKSVAFEIVSGDVVPPFTVTKGAMTTVVGDGKVDLSVGYAVHCEVESDKTVDIYAYYAEDGADTTNEVKIAEGVALDATGTGVIADLEPGVTYWVALGGKGGDTAAPPTEFTAVTVAGPAIGLTASATFTNDQKEFVVVGSVTPGIGTTTVYLRWSLNSAALDNLATYTFAYGDAGAFTNRVQYVNPTDTLTWDVAVSNSFSSTTYGEQKWDAALPASTKNRADSVVTTYTWTGAGENNDWANPANWTANRAECFGYPNSEDYAKAKVTRAVTINLGGKTFALVDGPSIILEANSGDVVTLTNGTLKANYADDGDFGATGATLIFRDATLDRERLNPKEGMTVIFEGKAKLTGMVRPWNSDNAKIIFRNGDITVQGNFGNGGAKSGTEVIISNATVTVQGRATSNWGPGTYPLQLQNGPDHQARLIHTNGYGFDFVQSPYTLAIPAESYLAPYLQALKPVAVSSASPTFNIDVTNWKHGKRVPILTFTQSASGVAEQYGNATLRAYENGVDVTEERHARLEWNATKRTLYYKQDGQFGMMIFVK